MVVNLFPFSWFLEPRHCWFWQCCQLSCLFFEGSCLADSWLTQHGQMIFDLDVNGILSYVLCVRLLVHVIVWEIVRGIHLFMHVAVCFSTMQIIPKCIYIFCCRLVSSEGKVCSDILMHVCWWTCIHISFLPLYFVICLSEYVPLKYTKIIKCS